MGSFEGGRFLARARSAQGFQHLAVNPAERPVREDEYEVSGRRFPGHGVDDGFDVDQMSDDVIARPLPSTAMNWWFCPSDVNEKFGASRMVSKPSSAIRDSTAPRSSPVSRARSRMANCASSRVNR